MSTVNNPSVSIGLPVYNGGRYLREALDSILAQTFTDFELIISDNASTDNTEIICKEYANRDKRISYYRNSENIGAAGNYNRTFELSSGKYFKWAAHDDLIAPEFLERCVAVLDSKPSVVLCYAREVCIDENGKTLRKRKDLLKLVSSKPYQRFKEYHDLWYKRGFTYANQCFALIRSSALAKTPLIGSYVWSELALGAELLLLGEFYEIPEYLFFFRCHENTSRATKKSSGYQQLAIWFDPKNNKKRVLPQWKLFLQYLKAIARVQIGWYDKAQCYVQMGRWLSWKWKSLVKELIQRVV